MEDFYEEFERVYDDRYQQQYGPLAPRHRRGDAQVSGMWRPSSRFRASYEGEGVAADDSAARERLASYVIHAPFSLARLHYDPEAGIVTYDPRPSSRSNPSPTPAERFSPLDALAALTAHIPAKGLST